MADIVGAACLVAGTLFMVLASVGAVRLPDLFTRMHAVTKGGTAGVGFSMLAVIAFDPTAAVVLRAVGVLLFVALTAPVSAHVLGRTAYRMRVGLWEGTFADELREHQEKSGAGGEEAESAK